jgi:LysM repeat protein
MDTSPSQESSIPWTKVTSKRGHSPQDDSTHEAKHSKEDSHWLHPITTFSALSIEESSDAPQSTTTGSNPKPPPIFLCDVTTISPLLQLLDQIALQQYEIKAS